MSRIRLQKLASLLGLLAILMSTLAPSVSQTLIAHHRLGNALTPDIYTVAWVAVAADGHRTQGHCTFTVK